MQQYLLCKKCCVCTRINSMQFKMQSNKVQKVCDIELLTWAQRLNRIKSVNPKCLTPMTVSLPVGEGVISSTKLDWSCTTIMLSNPCYPANPLPHPPLRPPWSRCSRCPLQDRGVHISWLAPCVWWRHASWTVAGVRESAQGRMSVPRSGTNTHAHLS